MSNMNEWDLLVAAEDVEPGDTLEVELEDGETTQMVFLKAEKGAIKLLTIEGETKFYSQISLEEMKGYSFITGKSEDRLDAREILRRTR